MPEPTSYKEFASQQGFTQVEVLDWTSSSGDWDFVVSKDGTSWFLLTQRTDNIGNKEWSIDLDRCYEGTAEQAIGAFFSEQVFELL